MILIACSIFLCMNSAITWENTNELQNALYVYDMTVGLNGYIYAGTKIDNGGSLDCGRVFYSQDMWNWQLCDSVPWVVGDTIEGVYALINGAGDTLFAGTGLYHSEDVPRIHKSSDGGVTWTPLNPYGSFKTGSRVYALLEDNLGILHLGNNYWGMSAAYPRYSTDRGVTWDTGTGLTYHADEYCFCQSTDNTIYLGTWGNMHYSSDNGLNWNIIPRPSGVSDVYTIIEVGADTIFMGTDADIGRLFMTTDQGEVWIEKGDGYFNSTTAIRSLQYASDGAIYAGTSPNAEVFVSVDKGDTWISTGVLSGANTVYKLIEVTKAGVRQDSTFLFAATGPNGDVFRGLLFVVGIDEKENIFDNTMVPQVSYKTPVLGDFMSLNISVNSQRPAELNILNATGAVVHKSNYRLKQGNNSLKISMHGFGQGIYFLRLDMGNEYIIRKVVHLK